jgi:hypothetical protein
MLCPFTPELDCIESLSTFDDGTGEHSREGLDIGRENFAIQ